MLHISLLNRLLITMAFKVTVDAFMKTINDERYCFEKGNNGAM